MTNAFSIKEAILFGWEKVRANSGLVFGVVVTMVAVQIASSMLSQPAGQESAAGSLGSLLLAFVSVVLGAGTLSIFLKLSRDEAARYRDILPQGIIAWRYFCVSLVAGIITFLPLMAAGLIDLVMLARADAVNFSEGAIKPGNEPIIALAVVIALAGLSAAVYLGLRYSFARMAAVDGMGINESMRESSKLTAGVKIDLLLFGLAIVGINILGFIALLIGLLVSIPVSLFATFFVYLKLKEARE